MKTLKINPHFKLITLTIAVAANTLISQPAFGEKSQKAVPEIGWDSRISSMGLDEEDNLGKKFQFKCQAADEDLIHAPIWGTELYTVNSGICSTAVHAGMLDPERGGKITIKLEEGQSFYTGSSKNSVVSKDHRSTTMSFSFVGEKKVIEDNSNSQAEKPKEKREPSAFEKVLMQGFQRGIERSIEKTISDILE